MRLIADLHIHSKYSRACSRDLELPTIARWCERKGIDIVATGDWTHPKWFSDIRELLVESESGLYKLKDGSSKTRFMLITEVSQIYKRGGATRRIHNLVFSPSIETCAKVNAELTRREFNLKSDGRPILGIDSEDLYEMLKGIDERIIVVPAHAWTPWYAVFGSKSGFDSLEECFGKMTPYIYAIETGLSSDPSMNWQLSALDSVVLISNSDAHSCRKLGREANVFDLDTLSYGEFVRVLREKDRLHFLSTIEFFPEEGKYHEDGCAACSFSCSPEETQKHGGRCPTCKKLLTLGVRNRVKALADRLSDSVAEKKIPFRRIVPLEEIIAEAYGVASASSKRVVETYGRMTAQKSEFSILLDMPEEDLRSLASDPMIVEAIMRVRRGELTISPGYDGVFGTVKIFSDADRPKKKAQQMLI